VTEPTPDEESGSDVVVPAEEDRATADDGFADEGDDAPEAGDQPDLGSEVQLEGEATFDEAEEAGVLGGLEVESTEDIEVPDRLVDQVIGQDHARDVIKRPPSNAGTS